MADEAIRTARRWRLSALTALTLVAAGAGVASAHDSAAPSEAGTRVSVLIDGRSPDAARLVADVGGSVTGRLAQTDGVVASVPESAVERVKAALPDVAVTREGPSKPPSAPAPTSDASTSLADIAALIGADRLRAGGLTGSGVDVAVLDTGIAPVPGLDAPGKVINGPDLSFDSQVAGTRYLDGFGHGTNMASIIAANGAVQGVAPEARLVNVKVGASNGTVDVSQIIAAIDWIVQHRTDNGMNIRVLNVSFGTDSQQRAAVDPLVQAADRAWRAGIVVVAAVGNDGRADGTVASPAKNPNILAVGAVDTLGSRNPSDAVMAPFSSQGSENRTPDLVAPGARVLGLRVPGSYLDTKFPAARRDGTLFRGSGTSQATAVVSGAAALLLQQRPNLTPAQVKALLMDTALPMDASKRIAGKGMLDVATAASTGTPERTPPLKKMKGTGSLEASRGSAHLVMDGVVLQGERDIFGAEYDSERMAELRAAGNTWSGGVWNGNTWSGSSWSGSSWSGASWSGASWSGASWSTATWYGNAWY